VFTELLPSNACSFSWSLHSNSTTHYIAPSLRLFVWMICRHTAISFPRAVLGFTFLRTAQFFCGVYSPTAPYLRLLIPRRFLFCVLSSFISEGANPSIISSHSFFKSCLKSQLLASRPPTQEFVLGSHIMYPCFPDVDPVSCFVLWYRCQLSPSWNVAARLQLGLLCHCCIPVAPDISSQTSVPSGFVVQPYPLLVPDNSVPCDV
jgi:hypothetical protein